jgi:2-iminobutanoate/2-iminopropanoate deaminase
MTSRKPIAISTISAPAAIGPYSQGVRVGDLLFLSGQIALDPETGQMSGATVEEQTRQVMKNISGLLESQGLAFQDIVKSTVFLKNMGDFGRFNETYSQFLKSPYPARSTVEVAKLPKDALVEIEVIAYCAG